MSEAAKLEDNLDDGLEERDDQASELDGESDDSGQFYQVKPDILYEKGDDQSYEMAAKSTEFLLTSRVFLEEELVKLVVHHQIELNADENVERIAREAFELAEEMNAKKMWPTKLGVKAALRIALKKIVHFKYKKHFELSGIAKIRVQIKIPSVEEQIARNKSLIEVWTVAKKDVDLRSTVMALAKKSLQMEILPEAFNRTSTGDISAEQVNDLTVNWLFSLDAGLDERHKVLLVLMLCKAFNQQSLYAEYARAYEMKADAHELKREVDQLSEELKRTFSKVTDADFQNFLRTTRIDGREPRRIIGADTNDDTEASSRVLGAYLKDLRNEAGSDRIESTPKVLALRYIDLIKAKSGDFTARNDFVRTILRFVVTLSRRMSGGMADNIAQANMISLEKAIGYDFRYEVPMAHYMSRWFTQSVTRMEHENRDVRIPVHMVEFMGSFERFLSKYPELERSQALDIFGAMQGKMAYVKKMKEAVFLSKPNSLDDPLVKGEKFNLGDLIADKSEMANFGEVVERADFRDKIEMAVDCLPSFYAVLMRLKIGMIPGYENESFNLQQIGNILGLSRERVRQFEEIIINALKSFSQDDLNGLKRAYYYLRNEQMFATRLAKMGLAEWQVEALKMIMGLDAGKLYKMPRWSVMAEELGKRYGIKIDILKSQKILGAFERTISESPQDFGLSEISLYKSVKYCRGVLETLYDDRQMSEDFKMEVKQHLELMQGDMQKVDWGKLVAGKIDTGEVRETNLASEASKKIKSARSVKPEILTGADLSLEQKAVPDKNVAQAPDAIRTDMLSRTSKVLAVLEAKHLPIANAILSGKSPREVANDLQVPLAKVMIISARIKMLVANNSK